ncbi:MAG TPA: hypothetical protein VNO84_02245 [Burkholderiaceae bacterium]|jgi:hypothetical protein|nr:hypothetical protein [Burkholderiaceae bacterium]
MAPTRIPRPAWTALACAALMAAGLMGPAEAQTARERYLQERERCNSGQTHQDRATCLREAAAAYQAARRGELSRGLTENDFRQNALARCRVLPPADQAACEARVDGEGTVSGSVEEGGIYREYREIVPAEPGAAGAGPSGMGGTGATGTATPGGSPTPSGSMPSTGEPPARIPPTPNPSMPTREFSPDPNVQPNPNTQFSGTPTQPPGAPQPAPGSVTPTQPGTVPGQIGPSTTPGMAEPAPAPGTMR